MSDIKGKTVRVQVHRVPTSSTLSASSRKPSISSGNPKKSHHGLKRAAKNAAAGLGVAYGAATCIPAHLVGGNAGVGAKIPAFAYCIEELIRRGEPGTVGTEWALQTSRVMSAGYQSMGGKFIVQPAWEHFQREGKLKSRGARKAEKIMCPWMIMERQIASFKASREEERRKSRETSVEVHPDFR